MRRFMILTFLVGLFGLTFTSLVPQPAQALSGSQFQPGRIIDDGIFFNPNTMNAAMIQVFLNAKVPTCDTWHAAGGGFNPPFTCLKDYRQDVPAQAASPGLCDAITPGNKSAAEIIHEVAQRCGINPQVILVQLQKEQSLVTDTWPWPTQYRTATGYGCPDTASCDAQYYGFFNQVYSMSKQFKRYVANPNQYNYRAGFNNSILFHPNAACGSSTVRIENYATAALYNYTPYQPNAAALNNLYGTGDGCSAYGNRNFWRLFNDWFGTTFGTVLLKGSGPTIYVHGSSPNVAYPVASGELLRAYGLDRTPVTGVSDSYLSALDTSQLLGTLFMKPLDQTIYLADGGSAIGIASGSYCDRWALPCNNPAAVVAMPYAVTIAMPTKAVPLTELMQFDNRVFVMNAGQKSPLINSGELGASPYAATPITVVTSPLNSAQPGGPLLSYGPNFFKVFQTNAIYYVNNGKYVSFGTFDTFKTWWDGSAVQLDKYSSLNATPPTAVAASAFAHDASGDYVLNGSQKLKLPSAPTPPVTDVTVSTELAGLMSGKTTQLIDSTKALHFPNGVIAVIDGGQIRAIPTMADFGLMFGSTALEVPGVLANGYPGGPLLVPSGRVVKPAGGQAIYLYGSDRTLWLFNNLSEVQGALRWFNNVLGSPASSLDAPATKAFTSLFKMNGQYYALQPDGTGWLIPGGLLQSQKDTLSAPIAAPMAGRIPATNREIRFIHSNNGVIAWVNGNEIHPLTKFTDYVTRGGSPSNTLEINEKALPAFVIGQPI